MEAGSDNKDTMAHCLFSPPPGKILNLRALGVQKKFPFRDESQRTHPSSHTPYFTLTTPEKDKHLHHLCLESKHTKLQLDRLREKIDRASHNAHAVVDRL